ncbi:MAG: DMT family transporter [Pseudomonadales bacterium]|nr:DMT family transporter [Pseudomonadales bacterium]NRA14986.1 DMT family transporter [Oceanospirillaceae bacterium]
MSNKFSYLLLILVAAIWGFSFVAQSAGMEFMGPHSFNAARFILATVSLLPLWFAMSRHKPLNDPRLWLGGLLAGTVMFAGFSFQQIGLLHTSAGNAGFITGMYIVLVPIVGVFLKQHTSTKTWFGVVLAVVGLFVLCVDDNFSIGYGDSLQLIGVIFWTMHVLAIAWLASKVDAISLSIIQFTVAAVFASIFALLYEQPSWEAVVATSIPLLYAGIASSGIACTLQIIGQRNIEPSIAALILASEAMFAVLGGWILLDESMSSKELSGCLLMLLGMIVSQWPKRHKVRLVTS